MARFLDRASSARVSLPSPTPFTTAGSVSAWVRSTSALPGSNQFRSILSMSSATSVRNWYFDYRNISGNFIELGWWSGGAATSYRYSGSLTTNQWYHLVASVDWTTNPDTVVLYIDGASVSLSQNAGTNNASPDSGGTHGGAIGALHANGAVSGDTWQGDLAEVAYWHAALTAGEALALSKGAPPALIRPASLSGWHPFFDGVNCRVRGAATNTSTTASDHPPIVLMPAAAKRIYAAAPPPPPPPPSGPFPFKRKSITGAGMQDLGGLIIR